MSTNDSTDQMRAINPLVLMQNVLQGMNKISADVGAMRAEVSSLRDKLDEHRDTRNRDDDDIKEMRTDFEKRLRVLEEAKQAGAMELAAAKVAHGNLADIAKLQQLEINSLKNFRVYLVGAAAGGGGAVMAIWELLKTATGH